MRLFFFLPYNVLIHILGIFSASGKQIFLLLHRRVEKAKEYAEKRLAYVHSLPFFISFFARRLWTSIIYLSNYIRIHCLTFFYFEFKICVITQSTRY